MEAVAADSGVRIFAGDSERLSNRRLAAMESGVETGDLRQIRMGRRGSPELARDYAVDATARGG